MGDFDEIDPGVGVMADDNHFDFSWERSRAFRKAGIKEGLGTAVRRLNLPA